jgi:uncharacterized membrane protein
MRTANQIKSEFETLASGHYQIQSFLYAQEFEQQAYENLIYPLMLVYPLGGGLQDTTYTRNYRVIIADRVLKSEGNELEVESDTQLICLDVLAYWKKLGLNERFTISSSETITPFWEKWGDEVTGHFVDIGIEMFYDFNSCAIPMVGTNPSPINPCKDARILVNSVIYGNAPSDTNFNVVVKNTLGAVVGSLVGGEWIVPVGGVCADANYDIEDSNGNSLYSGSIPSGGSLIQTINDSTLDVNNSSGGLISSRSILAEGTDSYNVADSIAVIKDSANNTLKTENILATISEDITINDSTLNVNKSDGTLISSRTILAESTTSYNVADSTAILKDEDGNTLSSTPIKATESTNITAPNGDVSVNNVAFDDVLSGGTLNIEVRKSTGNDLIGSKQGQYWRIGDSTAVIKNASGTTLFSEAIKATESENITIGNSTINNSDSSYSASLLAQGLLTLPDSQINVNGVDEGDIISVKAVNVNIVDDNSDPVTPTNVGLVGNTLTIEVPPSGASPSGVAFNFPAYWQRTSYRTGDVGDRMQTGWMADLVNPAYPKAVAELDYSNANWWQTLLNPLIVDGVSSTTRLVDVDGGQTWSATGNKNLVTIDKLSGFMYYNRNINNGATWDNAIDNALALSIVVDGVTYDDWYLCSIEEYLHIFGNWRTILGGLFNSVPTLIIGSGNDSHWSSTTAESLSTFAQCFQTSPTGSPIAALAKTTAGQRSLYVRKALNLITAP